jgi:hypothetical protein
VFGDMESRPKTSTAGGLGILDIERMGIGLRLRWLWFRLIDPNMLWSKLPISVDKCTSALFDASL